MQVRRAGWDFRKGNSKGQLWKIILLRGWSIFKVPSTRQPCYRVSMLWVFQYLAGTVCYPWPSTHGNTKWRLEEILTSLTLYSVLNDEIHPLPPTPPSRRYLADPSLSTIPATERSRHPQIADNKPHLCCSCLCPHTYDSLTYKLDTVTGNK